MSDAISLTGVQGIYDESVDQLLPLGTRIEMNDGRVFRYAQAGAAVVVGKLYASIAPAANHTNEAVQAASAIGDKTVSVTLGATAVTAGQYVDGYLQINSAAGLGHNYKIKAHGTHAGTGTLVFTM